LFLVARVIAVRICNCALLICCLFGQVSLEKEVLNLNSATMLVVAGHFSVIFFIIGRLLFTFPCSSGLIPHLPHD